MAFHVHNHPGVLKIVNMNGMRIYFRDILLLRISRGANNCVQRVFEKNIYFIMIFLPPPILNSYYPMKG